MTQLETSLMSKAQWCRDNGHLGLEGAMIQASAQLLRLRLLLEAKLSPDAGTVEVDRGILKGLIQAHHQSTVDWDAMRKIEALLEGDKKS